MSASFLHPSRRTELNDRPMAEAGRYILYWMQASQRAAWNPALEYAVETANAAGLPLRVVFGLTGRYPEANARHYTFMLEGLRETQQALARRSIPLTVLPGKPPAVAVEAAREAACLVCDLGYLRHQRAWRREVAAAVSCRAVAVEGDAIVPVATVSDKAEYAARTLRPKIHRHLPDFRAPIPEIPLKTGDPDGAPIGIDLADIPRVITDLQVDRSVPPVSSIYRGGTAEAERRFEIFCREVLPRYADNGNQPQTDDVSHISPYLHFGQISPLYLLRQVETLGGDAPEARSAYIEELLVRRELAINHVWYRPDYDRFSTLPGWAKTTLADHADDPRTPTYKGAELDRAATHDPYWNAAMAEMRKTGFMHNYMRMYWGKKVLEWTPDPERAFDTLLRLNNRYFLDGRDPNSCAGVGWIFGLHDRAWKERPVFGKVRYMAASGLERKSDIAAYVRRVEAIPEPDWPDDPIETENT